MYHRAQRLTTLKGRLAIALLALLVVGCSRDELTQPPERRLGPGAPPSFDVHGNWGQRGRLVDATILQPRIDRSTVAGAVRAAVAASLPNTPVWAPSKAALQDAAVAAFAANYDVQQWSITYTTEDLDGRLVVVSAGVYLPVDVGAPIPLISVDHGTLTDKAVVPSSPGIIAQGLGHASHGSAVVFPDYIGMGVDAQDAPRYLISDINAETSLDALRATRALMKQLDIRFDGRLFISGYSQGGQVAMALARMMESDPRSGFRVTAAATASGPYDLYMSVQVALADSLRPYLPLSIYATYGIAAYNDAYHLAERLDQLLIPSAAAVGERLLTTGMRIADIAPPNQPPLVPTIAAHALEPDVLDAILHDPDYPLSRALRNNQTYDWVPTAPLRLYYGDADRDVAPINATFAADYMHMHGASSTDVLAVELVGPNHELLNHGTALWPSIIATRQWFDTFAAPSKSIDDDDAEIRND